LAGIALPLYQNMVDDAREREARGTLRVIYNAQRMHHADHNSYSGSIADLSDYMDDPNDDNDFYVFSIEAAGQNTFTAQALRQFVGTLTIDETGEIN